MIRALSLLFVFCFSLSSGAAEFKMVEPPTELEKFLESYPTPGKAVLPENPSFDELLDYLATQEADYSRFYSGPAEVIVDEESGQEIENHEYESWRNKNLKRALKAEAFVSKALAGSTEELNLLSLEMMELYLDKPEWRPALKELIMAFTSLRFNSAVQNQLDMKSDWRHQAPSGALVAGGLAAAVCVLRPQRCAELGRKISLIKKAKDRLHRAREKRGWLRRNKKPKGNELVEKALLEISGGQHTRTSPTAGSTLAKASYFKQYAKTMFIEGFENLKLVSGIAVVGGAGHVAFRKSIEALNRGDFENVALSPEELERKYFGGLAVFELSCQARELLKDEKASRKEIIEFTTKAHEEILLLGRMLGGKQVLQKTPLEFVTTYPETDEYSVEIVFENIDEDSFTYISEKPRKCPNIADYGTVPHASLKELEEYLIPDLLFRLQEGTE